MKSILSIALLLFVAASSYALGVIHARNDSRSYMLIQQAYNQGLEDANKPEEE